MSKKSTPRKDWREGRRMGAWELHEHGWKQKDIAPALGVSEAAVSQRMLERSYFCPSPVFRPCWLFFLVFSAQINKENAEYGALAKSPSELQRYLLVRPDKCRVKQSMDAWIGICKLVTSITSSALFTCWSLQMAKVKIN